VWLYDFKPPDKLRPVLVISRAEAIEFLHTVVVAPITTTVRGLPSEVVVGEDEGLKHRCAVNLDHLQTVEQARLKRFVGSLKPAALKQVCTALAIALGCDE
jgi:mRNA interferase MazF